MAATTSPATGAIAAPTPPAAQMAPSWPVPTAGPPGADALAAALAQQGGANNLIQAAAGLILRQQQQQQQQQQQHLAQIQLIQQAQAQAAAAQAAAAVSNPTALALAMSAAQQQQQQQQQGTCTMLGKNERRGLRKKEEQKRPNPRGIEKSYLSRTVEICRWLLTSSHLKTPHSCTFVRTLPLCRRISDFLVSIFSYNVRWHV